AHARAERARAPRSVEDGHDAVQGSAVRAGPAGAVAVVRRAAPGTGARGVLPERARPRRRGRRAARGEVAPGGWGRRGRVGQAVTTPNRCAPPRRSPARRAPRPPRAWAPRGGGARRSVRRGGP